MAPRVRVGRSSSDYLGTSTVSTTCTMDLPAATLAITTVALEPEVDLKVVLAPVLVTLTSWPSSVFSFWPFLRAEALATTGMTWYLRAHRQGGRGGAAAVRSVRERRDHWTEL